MYIKRIFFLLPVALSTCLFPNRSQAQKNKESTTQFPTTIQTIPRMRVIIDNDFGGDPDGLFQLAHLLLSPSVDTRAVIGSHLAVKDGLDPSDEQAVHAAAKASQLISLLHLDHPVRVLTGSNKGMRDDTTGVRDEAENFIIHEALRTDTKLPLYVLCGAGLTEVASALLQRPEIAGKFTLIWIGGPEYSDLALPSPESRHIEYNLNIDPAAARVVFNHSTVPVWQVPRDAYRQCLVSFSQLKVHVQPEGAVGAYLYEQLAKLTHIWHTNGEAYVLGDSPLVLLTALQSYFGPVPSSCTYVVKKAPIITAQGSYRSNPEGRLIRVYTRLDSQFMLNDFYDKLTLLQQNK